MLKRIKFWNFYFTDDEILEHDMFSRKLLKSKNYINIMNEDLIFLINIKRKFSLKRKISLVYFLVSLIIFFSSLIAMFIIQASSFDATIKGAMVYSLISEPFLFLIIYKIYSLILNLEFFYKKDLAIKFNNILMKYDGKTFNPFWYKWIYRVDFFMVIYKLNINKEICNIENEFERKFNENILWDQRHTSIWNNKYDKLNVYKIRDVGRILFFKKIGPKFKWKTPVEYGIDAIIWKICNEKANL